MKQNNNIIHGIEPKKLSDSADEEYKVRCLTLSFLSYKMLLPNLSVAEVTLPVKINPQLGAPDWFGGMIRWREQDVPIVILEKIMNVNASKPISFRRMLIINAPNNSYCSPFIALGCQSIPSVSVVEEDRVAISDIKSKIGVYIKFDGETYIIPRINVLENIVSNVMRNLAIRDA